MLDCTLSLGLQKVTLEVVFLTLFGTCFRRCPRTRLWVLDCTLARFQKVTLEVVFLRLWVLDCTFRTRLWMLDCTLSLGL